MKRYTLKGWLRALSSSSGESYRRAERERLRAQKEAERRARRAARERERLAQEAERIEAERTRTLELADVDNMNPFDFERYVAKLLEHRGFNAAVTKASGDYGVDILAEKSDVKYAVQVKRQSNPVSRRAVSDAVAGKTAFGCSGAMVVTNAYFTKEASKFAAKTGCELVGRDILTNWILDFQKPPGTQSS